MGIVALKCPNCRGELNMDDSRVFGFCQYCGTKVMIQEETVKQHVTIDRSKDLLNILKFAKLSLMENNISKVRDLVNKALEMDMGCSDALFMQVVVYARMGNNHNMVYDMAKESTKSLGVFTEKDMESMLGHRIVIAYDDTRSNSTIAEGVLDDYAPLMVSNDTPVSVYLPTGNHTFMLNERNTRYPLKFNVQYPRSFVIYHTDLGPTIGDRYTETSGPITTYISFKGYIGERPDYYRLRIDGGKEQSELYGKTAPYDLTPGDHRIEMQQVKMGLVSTKTTYRTEFHVKIRPNTNYSLKVVDGNLTLVPTDD